MSPASKSEVLRAKHQVPDDFKFCHALLRTKYGEPRVSTHGGILREFFELEDGKVIMFASPSPPTKEPKS